jgi:hypothetical protein
MQNTPIHLSKALKVLMQDSGDSILNEGDILFFIINILLGYIHYTGVDS